MNKKRRIGIERKRTTGKAHIIIPVDGGGAWRRCSSISNVLSDLNDIVCSSFYDTGFFLFNCVCSCVWGGSGRMWWRRSELTEKRRGTMAANRCVTFCVRCCSITCGTDAYVESVRTCIHEKYIVLLTYVWYKHDLSQWHTDRIYLQ